MSWKNKFNPGEWEVQRERFRIEASNPPPPETCEPVSDLVPKLLKKWGLDEQLWQQTLLAEWESLVGPQVAQHARPGRLERKTLHVFVRHPMWLSELSRYGQKQMLANLQKRFGEDKIKAIRLQLDPEAR
jgi:predicted nucleic acid-binding Zn ribbon protein